MPESPNADGKVFDILWSSLEGGSYDLVKLRKTVNRDTDLGSILDSLDRTDFVLRLEHYYKVNIAQADFPRLNTIAAIETYVRDKSPVPASA